MKSKIIKSIFLGLILAHLSFASYADHAGQFFWAADTGTPTYSFKCRFYSDTACNTLLSEASSVRANDGWTWPASVTFFVSPAIVCLMAGSNCLSTQSYRFITLDSGGGNQFEFTAAPCFVVDCTTGTDCINSEGPKQMPPIPPSTKKINPTNYNFFRNYITPKM